MPHSRIRSVRLIREISAVSLKEEDTGFHGLETAKRNLHTVYLALKERIQYFKQLYESHVEISTDNFVCKPAIEDIDNFSQEILQQLRSVERDAVTLCRIIRNINRHTSLDPYIFEFVEDNIVTEVRVVV